MTPPKASKTKKRKRRRRRKKKLKPLVLAQENSFPPFLFRSSLKEQCEHMEWENCVQLGHQEMKNNNRLRAEILWKNACEWGEAEGCHQIGVLALQGHLSDRVRQDRPDRAIALQALHRSSHLNHSESWFVLGRLYEQGKVVPINEKKAVRYYQRACQTHHIQACARLGFAHELGLGLPKANPLKALQFYRKACQAQFNWGCTQEQKLQSRLNNPL